MFSVQDKLGSGGTGRSPRSRCLTRQSDNRVSARHGVRHQPRITWFDDAIDKAQALIEGRE